MGMVSCSSSSVIIDEIDVVHVSGFKPERDSPVPGNRNAPKSSAVPSEWMQSVSRQIKVARLPRRIQVCQSEGDSVQLVGGYSTGVASVIESPQSPVAKRSNHEEIILRTDTANNGISGNRRGGAAMTTLSILRTIHVSANRASPYACIHRFATESSTLARGYRGL